VHIQSSSENLGTRKIFGTENFFLFVVYLATMSVVQTVQHWMIRRLMSNKFEGKRLWPDLSYGLGICWSY
jgi:hypothetical protein